MQKNAIASSPIYYETKIVLVSLYRRATFWLKL